jgi:hypothetical protein
MWCASDEDAERRSAAGVRPLIGKLRGWSSRSFRFSRAALSCPSHARQSSRHRRLELDSARGCVRQPKNNYQHGDAERHAYQQSRSLPPILKPQPFGSGRTMSEAIAGFLKNCQRPIGICRETALAHPTQGVTKAALPRLLSRIVRLDVYSL